MHQCPKFILFYFNLFYFILFLFYFILFYFILFCFILFYFILFCFILFYFILFWSNALHVSDGVSVRQQYLSDSCMYSLELLMMDGKPSETCRALFQNKIK